MTNNNILITGATGFIGSHLTEVCIELGYKVKAFDRYNPNNNWGWLENSKHKDEIEVILGDVRDYDSVYVKEELKTNNPEIIDYATKGYRTDLLGVYIAAKCYFFVSGNTGLDSLPVIFRRPLVQVDYVPLELVRGWDSSSLILLKKHWLKEEKRFMTFREILVSFQAKRGKLGLPLSHRYKIFTAE